MSPRLVFAGAWETWELASARVDVNICAITEPLQLADMMFDISMRHSSTEDLHNCTHCILLGSVYVTWSSRSLSSSAYPTLNMNRAMPSKVHSSSTLCDAENTLSEQTWRKVTPVDRMSMLAELRSLEVSVTLSGISSVM